MNTKKILSWLLLIVGEAILVSTFILFKGETTKEIFLTNVIVSSIIYLLIFTSYGKPWIDLNDKSQKQIGFLGISWTAIWIYTILAIATMIIGNIILYWTFQVQIIIHCILIFLLLIGMFAASHTSDKVKEIYQNEQIQRKSIDYIKNAFYELNERILIAENAIPTEITRKLKKIEEDLRYFSPSNNPETERIDNSIADLINSISFSITRYEMNKKQIEESLRKCEMLYERRKNTYSN